MKKDYNVHYSRGKNVHVAKLSAIITLYSLESPIYEPPYRLLPRRLQRQCGGPAH